MEPKTISALLKTSKYFTDHLRSDVVNYNLNLTEFGVLEALYQKGPLKVKELQDKVLVNNSTVSYTINKLVKDGLIIQKQCVEDKRIIYINLTDKGNTLIKDIAPRHYKFIKDLNNHLSSEEEETLRLLLKKLTIGGTEDDSLL